MQVTWDDAKEAGSIEKHSVPFVEARTALQDVDAVYLSDTDSSDDEVRWVVIGLSDRYRVLVVVTWEQGEDEIRIISARKANAQERGQYEGTQ